MKTILVKKNFGLGGKHIDPGTTLAVNPEDFGGTYDDFLKAGIFEEVPDTESKPATEEGVPQTDLPIQSRTKKPVLDPPTETTPEA